MQAISLVQNLRLKPLFCCISTMNVLQRAARTALQSCCRSLHTQTVTSSAADATAALTALRASLRFLGEADIAARLTLPGKLSQVMCHLEAMPSRDFNWDCLKFDVMCSSSVAGTLQGQAATGTASMHEYFMLAPGQEAVLLQRSEIRRMLTMSSQPTQATACSSFTGAPTDAMYADSVRRKRKTKMNKHKHRKRLKKTRHGSK